MSNRFLQHRHFIHLAAIAALVTIFYANSLHNGFSYDDFKFVVNNKAVHGFSTENLKKIFLSVPNGVEYLPIKDLTYCLDFGLWGLNPFGYHLSNLLYYIACCCAFYFFLSALLSRWREDTAATAFIITLIFALHPGHVASVASICQRKDLVSGFFLFLSLLCYLRFREDSGSGKYLLSLFLFLLSLLSKATVMTMPFVILMAESFIPEDRKIGLKKKLLLLLPFLLTVVAFALANYEILKSTGVLRPLYSALLSGYDIRIYTSLRAIFFNLKMLLVPFPLLMFHQFQFSKTFLEPAVILSLCGLIALLVAVYFLRKRAPVVSFGLGWCLVSLLPVVGLIPSNTLIAERYLFLPAAGFACIAGFLLKSSIDGGKNRKMISIAAICVLIAVYGGITFKRNADWKDNLTLILANIRDVPDQPSLYYLAGTEFFARGDNERTLSYIRQASKLNSFYDLHYAVYSAIMAYQNNRLTEALGILDRTQNSFKLYVLEFNYLYGKIYQSLGDKEKAALFYRNAKNSQMPLGVFSPEDAESALAGL